MPNFQPFELCYLYTSLLVYLLATVLGIIPYCTLSLLSIATSELAPKNESIILAIASFVMLHHGITPLYSLNCYQTNNIFVATRSPMPFDTIALYTRINR